MNNLNRIKFMKMLYVTMSNGVININNKKIKCRGIYGK
jgi:hypothetical protein